MQQCSRQVLCRCQTHCTTRNLATGLYEGEGHFISRSTRDSHVRDDQLGHAIASAGIPANTSDNWLSLYHAEVEILRTFPVVSRRIPLVFCNNPALTGTFVSTSDHEIMTPNRGMHKLTNDPVNRAFLQIEARYCQLGDLVEQMDATDERIHFRDILYSELRRLEREKQVQWNEQRSVVGRCYVNTGKDQKLR